MATFAVWSLGLRNSDWRLMMLGIKDRFRKIQINPSEGWFSWEGFSIGFSCAWLATLADSYSLLWNSIFKILWIIFGVGYALLARKAAAKIKNKSDDDGIGVWIGLVYGFFFYFWFGMGVFLWIYFIFPIWG